MAALTALEDVKAFAGVTVATYDATLAGIIDSVSEVLEKHLGMDFDAREIVERHSGGLPRIILDQTPATVDSVVANGTTLTGTDYEIRARSLIRLANTIPVTWESSFLDIVVTYTTPDSSAVPTWLEIAAREASVWLWKQSHESGAARLGTTGKEVATGGTQSYVTDMLELPAVREAMRHRRIY